MVQVPNPTLWRGPPRFAVDACRPDAVVEIGGPERSRRTMRHCAIATMTMRQANEDVEHAGVLVPKDSTVLVNTLAAKRDPALTPNPTALTSPAA